jgi:myo-inositol-1-phosphate synthase
MSNDDRCQDQLRNEHDHHTFAPRELTFTSRTDMHTPHQPPRKVRIGIVGVGNCANSLVQGLSYYREANSNEPVPGLMNVSVGGYHVRDIEVAAAFDVNARKVGKDVATALWESPNNTHRFADVAPTGVTVMPGRKLDGIGQYVRD